MVELLEKLPIDIVIVKGATSFMWGDCDQIDCPFDLAPLDYIEFAEKDLEEDSLRGNLNAMHNAKRAVSCAIDSIFWNYGFQKQSTASFPEKLDIIKSMGLVSPRIVRKLIKSRNILEHRYGKIESLQAEDAVDVAGLFVHALALFFSQRKNQYSFVNKAEGVEGVFSFAFKSNEAGKALTTDTSDSDPALPVEAIFFEVYKIIDAAKYDPLFQGDKQVRMSADDSRNKRGCEEIAFGYLQPALSGDYMAIVREMVEVSRP
jgi:uncharacterized protein YutE (UPF0331/DUF86 family)